MTDVMPLAQLLAITLAASLLIGLPVRVFGPSATIQGVSLGLQFLRRRRLMILGIGLVGVLFGAWSFESVRELVFGFFG